MMRERECNCGGIEAFLDDSEQICNELGLNEKEK